MFRLFVFTLALACGSLWPKGSFAQEAPANQPPGPVHQTTNDPIEKPPDQSGTGTVKPPLHPGAVLGEAVPAPQGQFLERLSHSFDGTSGLARYLHRDGAPATFDPNKAIYILDIRFQLSFDKDGKLALRGRLGTGANATDDTAALIAKSRPHFRDNLNLRESYLDYFHSKTWQFQGGALPLLSPEMTRNALSNSAIAWVDGVRGEYTPHTHFDAISATVGHLGLESDTSGPHRFAHEDPAPNFMQVNLRVHLNRAEFVTVQQTQLGTQAFTRFVSETAVKDALRIIDGLVLEEVIGSGDRNQKAFAISVRKNFGKLEILPYYIARGQTIAPTPTQPFLPLDTTFYPGRQIALLANRYVGTHQRFQIRIYKFEEPYVASAANHGWLGDVSYKYTWGKAK